jgi:glycolate oxidase iron-sulfur subunit
VASEREPPHTTGATGATGTSATSAPGAIGSSSTLVDYAKSLDCIHCGLCLQTCPTYRLTGVESSSPRGRIHLMRAVGEGRLAPDADYAEELDFCLLCRHCESVCPAGVRFGAMMEFARGAREGVLRRGVLARLARRIGFRVVLPSRLALRALGSLLSLAQTLRLDRLAARLGPRMRGLADLPRVPPLPARKLLPRLVPAAGAERQRMLFLQGCAMSEFHAHVNRATVESLARLGVASVVPPELVCCGSLHAHNGDLEGSRALARELIEVHERASASAGRPLALLTNSAGCGAHLKELHHLFPADDPWHARAHAVAEHVRDYTEVVAEHVGELPPLATGGRPLPFATPITWDDPCHLCHGQGIRREPRAILDRILGAERVELEESESCCGSAGIYSLLRPADAQAVFDRKLAAFHRSGARTLVTANPGCQIQWESGLRRAGVDARVLHLAECVRFAQEASSR